MTGIKFLTRKEIEKQFLGQLCEIISDQSPGSETNYRYIETAFKRDPEYKPGHVINPNQNWIDETKYEKNWWTKGGKHHQIKSGQFVLVVDIVRNHMPGWSAVILIDRETYLIPIESLLLKSE